MRQHNHFLSTQLIHNSTQFRMWVELVLLAALLLLLFYRYVTKNFNKWEQLAIPHIKGQFPMGSHKDLFLGRAHLNELSKADYHRFKEEPLYGWFLLGKPVLGVNNLDLVKNILVKDFNNFVDRNSDIMQEALKSGGDLDKLWINQMSNMKGDDWKDVRSAFSPIFTSGKLKTMLRFIRGVGENLAEEMDLKATQGEDFELKEVFGKFSLDSLASCAFGVDIGSFKDPNAMFVRNAARIFQNTKLDLLLLAIRFFPGVRQLLSWLRLDTNKPRETRFFRDIVRQAIRQRRESGQRRNDLIDLMIDAIKEENATSGEGEEDHEAEDQYEQDMRLRPHLVGSEGRKTPAVKLDEDIVVATAMIIMVAGYDTTGMTLSYAAYYLSKYPAVQQRLQQELDEAYEAAGGQLPDYSVIQGLPYLEAVVMETLRIRPPVGTLLRVCTKDYKIPGTNVEVKVDDMISIATSGIHSDPRYYPNPEVFNPDHFSKEAKAKRSPYAFLSFGQGPRACIGMRFALLEAKVALTQVLYKFTFLESSKNPDILITDTESSLGYVKGGLWAKVVPREKQETI